MVKRKVCLLGSYGVGKTSLVARFIHSIFSDKYHTTVGVKIDKKVLSVGGEETTLMIWDMAGEEDGAPVKINQVKDASGYLLVADGTRGRTLDIARDLHRRVRDEIGARPFLLLMNKADLRAEWEVTGEAAEELRSAGWTVLETSAKSGDNVEEAFQELAARMADAETDDDDDQA